jgi:hypothetical protein
MPDSLEAPTKMAVFQHAASQSLAGRCLSVAAGHPVGGAGLIGEDESFGIEIELTVEPSLPAAQNGGTTLFVRLRRLF